MFDLEISLIREVYQDLCAACAEKQTKEALKKELENRYNKKEIEALELIRKIEEKQNFIDSFFVNVMLLEISILLTLLFPLVSSILTLITKMR